MTASPTDREEYERLIRVLRVKILYGNEDEFIAAWQALEDWKNQHGGLPPKKDE